MRRQLCTSVAMACALGLALSVGFAAPSAHAQADFDVSVNVNIAPPPLPDYEQPPSPEDGYIWTPGYWAWDGDFNDYYWVPGTWVLPPSEGLLWTPAYWAYQDGQFGFVPGYWDTQVGFYGGIDYGYGYTGDGYEGGRWQDNHFYYNSTVNNVADLHAANVYMSPVAHHSTTGQVSFNGGPGGVPAHATPQQQAASRRTHVAATPVQAQHARTAASQPDLRSKVNHGVPAVAATSHPAEFSGPGTVRAAETTSVHQRPAAPARTTESAPPAAMAPARAVDDRTSRVPEQRPTVSQGHAVGPATEARPPMIQQNAPRPATARPIEGGAPPERRASPPPKPAPEAKAKGDQPRDDEKPR